MRHTSRLEVRHGGEIESWRSVVWHAFASITIHVRDAQWLADLLRHGVVRPSPIPVRSRRELQELTRCRRSLIEEGADQAHRIQTGLDGADLKLAGIISNLLGVGGRAMLPAMVHGETNPQRIAGQAHTRLRATSEQLHAALAELLGLHQRVMLATPLRHVDDPTEEIVRLDRELEERVRPLADAIARHDTTPGVRIQRAQEIIAAIGTDMSRLPRSRHLASWATLCPGIKESGGKRASASLGRGNFDVRDKESLIRRQVRRLEKLGCRVMNERAAVPRPVSAFAADPGEIRRNLPEIPTDVWPS